MKELDGLLGRLNAGIERTGYYFRLYRENGYYAVNKHEVSTNQCISNFCASSTRKGLIAMLYAMCKTAELFKR